MSTYFPNFGYMTHRFSDADLLPLTQEINEIQNNFEQSIPYNKDLAGHIKHEYELIKCRSYIENLVFPLVIEYNKQTKYLETISILTKALPISLTNLWVNFQKKHEFNPVHNHAGMMSFVIWKKIPFKTEDELNYFENIKAGQNRTSMFSFIFTDSLGNIQTKELPVDNTWENVICLFPSRMNHCVYPFYTSDDYRITISGNFKIIA
jgi:hypothetical protein